jgi:hypothetical protein
MTLCSSTAHKQIYLLLHMAYSLTEHQGRASVQTAW